MPAGELFSGRHGLPRALVQLGADTRTERACLNVTCSQKALLAQILSAHVAVSFPCERSLKGCCPVLFVLCSSTPLWSP